MIQPSKYPSWIPKRNNHGKAVLLFAFTYLEYFCFTSRRPFLFYYFGTLFQILPYPVYFSDMMMCVRVACQAISKSAFSLSWQTTTRLFSVCTTVANHGYYWRSPSPLHRSQPTSFLSPPPTYFVPTAGMKVNY